MAKRHLVFEGDAARAVWEQATARAVLDRVRELAEAVRAEVRFIQNRVDKTPPWPDDQAFSVESRHLMEAAIMLRWELGVEPTEGAPPEGFESYGVEDSHGNHLYLRRGPDRALALVWEHASSTSGGFTQV